MKKPLLHLLAPLLLLPAAPAAADLASHSDEDTFALEAAALLPQPRFPRAAPAQPADAVSNGQWSAAINWTPHIPVSAANLPDGRILTFASNQRTSFPSGPEFTYAATWNPATGQFQEINHTSHDMFCGALVMLPDGRVMVAGGRNNTVRNSTFDWRTNTWARNPDMNGGRWYNTAVALQDGQVFTVTGTGTGQNTAERWTGSSWSLLTGISWTGVISEPGYASNWHPFLSLAPDGRLGHFGPSDTMRWVNPQGTGSMVNAGVTVPGSHYPKEGCWVMYDEGRILVAGGSSTTTNNPADGTTGTSTTQAYTVDLRSNPPVVAPTAPMANARQFANCTVLPSGEVLVIGGNTSGWKFNDTGSIFPCEIWNPRTGTWRTVASISIPRNYHSLALLLPDGRVLSGGGGLGGANHQDAQLYSPPGLFTAGGAPAVRPVLNSAPESITPAAKFTVTGSTDIVQFAFIKMSSITHSVNTDLRRIMLPYTETTPGTYQLTAHSSLTVMTPGYWMLFGLNQSGAYSVSKVIRVDPGTPPVLTNPGAQTSATGVAASLTLNATVQSGVTRTFSATGLPPGLTISSATGIISGTPNTRGNHSVTVTLNAAGLVTSQTFLWSVLGGGTSGVIQHEWWLNISGTSLTALTGNANYPLNPTGAGTLSTFEAPTNGGDNLGRRIRGWLRPTVTGNYRFWIASDDTSELRLSTDASSAAAAVIARVTSSTSARQWTKSTSQASTDIPLTAGRFYYIEAIMKEGTGSDHLAVAWRPPGATGQTVIPASALTLQPVTINQPPVPANPGSRSGVTGTPVSLQLTASDPDNTTLAWTATGLPPGLTLNAGSGLITGTPTTAGSYTVNASVSDNINQPVGFSFPWTINSQMTLSVAGNSAVTAGTAVNVTASVTGGSNPVFTWSWGDGTQDSTPSSNPAATHTWAAPGRYRVVISATDATGRTESAQYYQAVHAPLTARQPARSSSILFEDRATGNDRIWSVNPDNDSVTAIDSVTRTRLAEISTGTLPHSVALAPDGRIWVVNTGSASISIINSSTLTVAATATLPRASRPFGLAFDPDGTDAWVACEGTGELLRLNVTIAAQTGSVNLGQHIRHLAITADSTRLLVSRFITPRLPGEETATVNTDNAGGEVIAVNASTLAVERTIRMQHSNAPDSPVSGRGIPNYLGVPAISPDGRSAWVSSKQDNIKRGLLRDTSNLTHDQSVRSITSRIDLSAGVPLTDDLSSRVDHDNASVATASAWDPRGIYVFSALEGSRAISVIDAWNRRELLRFDAGRAPQGITLSPDGRTLYAHNFMDRTVTVHDISGTLNGLETPPSLTATIRTIATERLTATVLRGKQLFYDTKDPRVSSQEYISCAACHNEGGEDGRVWDFTGIGEGLRNTISLRGRSGTGHGPLHWTGNFDEVQDFENQIRDFAGGTGLIEDAAVHPPMGSPNSGRSEDLDALAAYLASLTTSDTSPLRNTDGSLTAAAAAGRTVFINQNCAACHSGAAFTNSALNVFSDIGTIKPSSGKRLGATLPGLDVPTLRGLWNSAPYLHDGSAATLTNAVAAHQGVTLSSTDMANLVAYLQQIDDSELTAPAPATGVTNGLKGEYFNGRTFDTPVLTRTDASINFDWAGSPASGVTPDNFSIRWTGEILPAYSEDYTFYLVGDNGLRLTVNGTQLVNQWNPTAGEDGGWHSGTIRLTAGVRVPIKVEFYEAWGGAGVVLYWFSASQGWEAVPASRLFTGSAGPDVTKPGVSLSTTATGTLRAPFPVAVNFTESVTGLALSDFVLTNGTLSGLTGSGSAYTVTVTPGTATSATLTLPAGAAGDAAGNASTLSNTLTFTYGQNRAPTVALAPQTVARGLALSIQPSASDPDGDALTWSATGLPAGLSISSTTGVISGIVSSSAQSAYNSTITVTDPAGATASVTTAWTVSTAAPGLQAIYYNGRNFDTPVLTRVDSTVNFDWAGSPAPGVDPDNFSIRWTGTILPAYSEDYTFVIAVDNGVRLRVNNTLLIDQFGEDTGGWFSGTVRLTAGSPAALSIDYKEEWGGAGITVYWYSAKQAWEVLPNARLQPAGGSQPTGAPILSREELQAEAARVQPSLRIEPLPGGTSFDVVFHIPASPLSAGYILESSAELNDWLPWTGAQQRTPLSDGSTEVRTTIIRGGTQAPAGFFRVRVE